MQGAAWYQTHRHGKSPGTKIFCLPGNVAKPGNYELPLGTTFRHLIYELAAGCLAARPSRPSCRPALHPPILAGTDEILDTPMDYERAHATARTLGSASIIVMTSRWTWLAGQQDHPFLCPRVVRQVHALPRRHVLDGAHPRDGSRGPGRRGRYRPAGQLAAQIQGKCLCALGEFSTMAVRSGIEHFRADFRSCQGPAPEASKTSRRPKMAKTVTLTIDGKSR